MTKNSKPKTLLNFNNHLKLDVLQFFSVDSQVPTLNVFFLFILCCSMLFTIICNLQHSRFITQGWTFRSSKIQRVWRSLMNTKQKFKISSFWLPNMHWSIIYVVQNDEWWNCTMWISWINYCWDKGFDWENLNVNEAWARLVKLEHERGPSLIGKTWTWMGPRFHQWSLNMNKAQVWLTKLEWGPSLSLELQCWD